MCRRGGNSSPSENSDGNIDPSEDENNTEDDGNNKGEAGSEEGDTSSSEKDMNSETGDTGSVDGDEDEPIISQLYTTDFNFAVVAVVKTDSTSCTTAGTGSFNGDTNSFTTYYNTNVLSCQWMDENGTNYNLYTASSVKAHNSNASIDSSAGTISASYYTYDYNYAFSLHRQMKITAVSGWAICGITTVAYSGDSTKYVYSQSWTNSTSTTKLSSAYYIYGTDNSSGEMTFSSNQQTSPATRLFGTCYVYLRAIYTYTFCYSTSLSTSGTVLAGCSYGAPGSSSSVSRTGYYQSGWGASYSGTTNGVYVGTSKICSLFSTIGVSYASSSRSFYICWGTENSNTYSISINTNGATDGSVTIRNGTTLSTSNKIVCTIAGRSYYKYNSTAAYAGWGTYTNGSTYYAGPILLSTTANAVSFYDTYSTSSNVRTYSGTITDSNGTTWYYSSSADSMEGQYDASNDTSGSGYRWINSLVGDSMSYSYYELVQVFLDFITNMAEYDTWFSVSNTLSRTGYTFSGWSISGADSVTHYYGTSSSSYSTTTSTSWTYSTSTGTRYFLNLRSTAGTVTLTAQWIANTYDISVNTNGATGGSVTIRNGTTLSTANTVICTLAGRSYYKYNSTAAYVGWGTYANGSSYYAGPILLSTTASAVSFYDDYSTSSNVRTYIGTITDSNGVVWYYSSSADSIGIEYDASGDTSGSGYRWINSLVGDSTSYSYYELVQVFLDFITTMGEYESWVTISNTLTRTGYTFSGWAISGADSVTHCYGTSSSAYSTTRATSWTYSTSTDTRYFLNLRSTSGTVTFAAQWVANTYEISVDTNGATDGSFTIRNGITTLNTANVVICTIAGRSYYKYNSNEAYVAWGTYLSDSYYAGPILLSTTASAVSFYDDYSTSSNVRTYSGTITDSNGTTWYYSSSADSMEGEYTASGDTSGSGYRWINSLVDDSIEYSYYELVEVFLNYITGMGEYDSWITVSNTLSRTGYKFSGWAISGADSVTHYYGTSSSLYSATTSTSWTYSTSTGTRYFMNLRSTSGTVTLTALWIANTYEISINTNSATGGSVTIRNGTTLSTANAVICTIAGRSYYKYNSNEAYVAWGTYSSESTHYAGPILLSTTASAVSFYDTYSSSSSVWTYSGTITDSNGMVWYYSSSADSMEGQYIASGDTSGSGYRWINSLVDDSLGYSYYELVQVFLNYITGMGEYDSWVTISNTLTRTGYTFSGWAISGADSGTHYYGTSTSSGSYDTLESTSWTYSTSTGTRYFLNLRSTSGTVTFTAQWTAKTTTVKIYEYAETALGSGAYEASAVGTVSYSYYYNRSSVATYDIGSITTSSSNPYNTVAVLQGYNLILTASNVSDSSYYFVGFSYVESSSASDISTTISSTSNSGRIFTATTGSPTTTLTLTPSTNYIYIYVFYKQVSDNQLKYDSTEGYWYFEDGVYPQSYAGESVSGITSSTAVSYTLTINGQTVNVYSDGTDYYALVTAGTTSAYFLVEPIRWVVAYGSSYPSGWTTYASYSSSFNVVSAYVLSYGAVESDETKEGWAWTSSDLYTATYSNASSSTKISLSYSSSSSKTYNNFNSAGSQTVVSSTTTTVSNAYYTVVSTSDITTVAGRGSTSTYRAKATDLVAFLASSGSSTSGGSYTDYWTRDLSYSQTAVNSNGETVTIPIGNTLGNGVYITATGRAGTSALNVSHGVRFSYTCSQASRV